MAKEINRGGGVEAPYAVACVLGYSPTRQPKDYLTISIYMTIIMYMNIYITKDNEKFLRELSDKSMSGIINKLLNDYRNGIGPDLFPPDESVKESPKSSKTLPLCEHYQTKGNCLFKGCKFSLA